MHKPRLAYFVGDPNGVGPELSAGLLARAETHAAADIKIFGDPRLLNHKQMEIVPGLDEEASRPGARMHAAGAG